MRISVNRLFPYPVIHNSIEYSDYKHSIYTLEMDQPNSDKNYYYLNNVRIKVENDNISELLDKGVLEAYLLVECSSTIYREKFKIGEQPIDLKIDIYNLNGTIEITSFIVALKDFELYSEDFLEDYENVSFKIEKGGIVAIEQGFNSSIDYSNINDKKTSSIFLIIYDDKAKDIKVDLDHNPKKIEIYLPKKQYDEYHSLKNNDNFYNLFFSIIAIPALCKGLQVIQNDIIVDELSIEDEIEVYKWFNSVVVAYKKKTDKLLSTDDFIDMDVVELAQIVLDHSSSKAIDDIMAFYVTDDNGGDEDE